MDSRLARTLEPLDSAPIIMRQRYICSRLNHAPDRWVHHRKLLASMPGGGNYFWPRTVWRASALLPCRLFDKVINIALTQNRLKQSILQLKRFVTKVRRGLGDNRNIRTERRNYGNVSAAQHRNTGI
jgi:hypothetical protein